MRQQIVDSAVEALYGCTAQHHEVHSIIYADDLTCFTCIIGYLSRIDTNNELYVDYPSACQYYQDKTHQEPRYSIKVYSK